MFKYLLVTLLVLFSINIIAGEAVTDGRYKASVPAGVINYQRLNNVIATSGSVSEVGLLEIQKLGFKTIIDLRSKTELAMDNESDRAQQLGLRYLSLPVSKAWPSAELLKQFSTVIDDPDNHPVLVHCRSGNRVGFVWGLHQLAKAVAPQTVLTEAKRIGLKGTRLQALQNHMDSNGE